LTAEARNLVIRRFRNADESCIRDICYATGFLGNPVDRWIDANKPLFTDFWLEYYLRREPESLLVAEVDGRVVGYLTGCTDPRKRARYMGLPFLLHVTRSLLQGRYRAGRKTAAVLLRLVRDLLTAGLPRRPGPGYGAHMHYNVVPELRTARHGCGVKLAAAFCRVLLERGIPGFHGFMILPSHRIGRRYRSLGRIHDARKCRLFEAVCDEDLFLASMAFDVSEIVRRYPGFFPGVTGQSGNPKTGPAASK